MTTTALIIGGGVAGPITGIALRRAGIDAVVYEAYDRSAEGIGAFLTLAVNGIDALAALGLDGLVRDVGIDTPRFAFFSGTGRKLGEVPNGPTRPDGTVSQTVKRADLYGVLRDEAARRGVRVEYGKRLVAARSTPDGRVVAVFDDGTTATGDLLVGADGLGSRTREIIDPAAPTARYVGLLNAGGYAPSAGVPGTDGVLHMLFGKKAFLGYLKSGDEVWWFANPPSAKELGPAELAAITPDEWRARLVDLVQDDRTPARHIIESTKEILVGWNTYDFPTVPVWHKDRMVIIGDAAHAASPAAGQGASMAMEDAVTLAKCLRDVPDVPAALATYERLRRDRVERVVAQGKRNGDQKSVGPARRFIRDAVLTVVFKRMERAGADPNGWMYEHHIDWDARVS